MKMHLALWCVLCAAFAGGCAKKRQNPAPVLAPVPVPVPMSAPVSAPAPAPLPKLTSSELCTELRLRADMQWQTVNKGHKDHVDYRNVWPTVCLPTPLGAWTVVHRELKYSEGSSDGAGSDEEGWDPDKFIPSSVSGRWSLIFMTLDQKEHAEPPHLDLGISLEGKIDDPSPGYQGLTLELVSDYDKDGVNELFAEQVGAAEASHDAPEGRLLTVKDGAIAVYPGSLGLNVADVKDADNDGLVDLWVYGPFEERYDNGYGQDYLRGPRLLMHARPDGSFAPDDAVARVAAKEACQSALTLPILDKGAEPSEEDLQNMLLYIACARIRGVGRQRLLAQIAASCKKEKAGPCNSPHDDIHPRELMEKWVAAEPAVHGFDAERKRRAGRPAPGGEPAALK